MKKTKWEIELDNFRWNEYRHEENDGHVCSSFYKRCSVCHLSSDYGATSKECRHPWTKYELRECDCGADKAWSELVTFVKKLKKYEKNKTKNKDKE